MAISAVAGLVSAIGAGAFGATVFGFTAAFSIAGLAGLGAAFALGAGLSMVSRALAPKPNLGAQMRGITQTSREPAGSRKVVYGKMRVGGQVVFISNSGDDNKYLHMAIAFASHEIESYEEIWFNDKKVWTLSGGFQGDWGTYVTIDRKFGTDGQAASTNLVNSNVLWTTNHKLSGISYIAFRLEWDTDKFPQGVPNITAVLKGKKVYDPRTSSTGWSQNPALCLRDYMLDDKYGLGEVAANIDSTAINAAANLCEEQITLDGGGTQDRYQCNGVIETGNQIRANIEQLLSSMGGMLTYSGGKYFIDGAEYKAPTLTFTEADVISDIQTQTKQSRRGVYNGVKGIFVSEEKNYKVLDYPPQISSTYATEDGDPIYLDMALPFVTNNTQAQRLAKIALLKSRQQVVINMTVNLKGLQVKIGDTINVTNDRLNYSSKIFQVIDYSLAIADGGALAVNLACIETASAVYDWTTSDEEDFLSGGELDLYDGRTVANVTSLALTEVGFKGPDGNVISAVDLTWTGPTDAFVELYKVRYNKTGTTNYFYTSSREPRVYISGLDITSNYDFRVQAENLIGVSSSGTTLSNQALNGDTTAPSVPTSASATGGIQTITAEWTNPSDIDFKHVEVFVNTTDSIPASPTAVVDGEEYIVTGLSGAATRYFWLKSVDFSGNKSAATASFNGASVVATGSDIGTGAVDTGQIADGAVDTDQIADDAVTVDKLTVSELSAITADIGDITGGTLQAGGVTDPIPSDVFTRSTNQNIPTGDENGAFIDLNAGSFVFGDADSFISFAENDGGTAFELDIKGVLAPTTLDLSGVTDDTVMPSNMKAQGYVDASVGIDALSDAVWNEIDGRVGQGTGGFYATGTGFYLGAATQYITIATTQDHGTEDVTLKAIIADTFTYPRNFFVGSDQLKIKITLQYKVASGSTWVTAGATQTRTLTPTLLQYATRYTIDESYSVTLTSGSGNDIADDTDYDFRLKLERVGSQSAFADFNNGGANDTTGTPVTFEASENASGVAATGGNADTLDNLDSTQFLRSDATDTMNGSLTITGDLTVQGTQTTLEVATLDVEDKNITLNYGTGDTSGSANGAGITIQDAVNSTTDATILWDATNDEFDFSHPITWTGGGSANANTAYTYSQVGHLPLAGGTVTGNVTISGSGIEPLTVGATSARKYIKLVSSQWPEIRFHNADHELQRIGMAHQNESSYGLDEGDFYIYDPSSNQMRLRIPKDGASFVRDEQYTVVDTGNLSTTLSGYLTAEADTLATVTGRGATTTNAISTGAITSSGNIQASSSAGGGFSVGTDSIIGSNKRLTAADGTTVKASYGFQSSSTTGISYTASNNRVNILSNGAVKAYIQTGSSNPLVETMDVDGYITWDGGSSTNANTAYTYSQVGHLPLAGGSMSGSINMGANNISNLGTMDTDVKMPRDHKLYFQDGNSTTGNVISSGLYPSQGYTGTNTFWIEYAAKGGHNFIVNTDGGSTATENTFDHFTIWQGAVDGRKLFYVTNSNGHVNSRGSFYPSNQSTNYVDSSRIANWQTAYGWGDHSTAGYISTSVANTFTALQTFSGSADANWKLSASNANASWRTLEFEATTEWGDAPSYGVLGGTTGVMLRRPHIVWSSGTGEASIRLGRSGGTSSGKWVGMGVGQSNQGFLGMETTRVLTWDTNYDVQIAAGDLQMGTATVIDSSRNITSGTISSGAITSSGALTTSTGVIMNTGGDKYWIRWSSASTTGLYYRQTGGEKLQYLYGGSERWGVDNSGNMDVVGTISSGSITSTGTGTFGEASGVPSSTGRLKFGTDTSSGWGTTTKYPYIGSDGTGTVLVMFQNPHVVYRTDNVRSGASGRAGLRMARDAAGNWWDMGLIGDEWELYRSGTGQLLHVNNAGNLTVTGTLNSGAITSTGTSSFAALNVGGNSVLTSGSQITTAGSITAGNASTSLGYYVGVTQVIQGSTRNLVNIGSINATSDLTINGGKITVKRGTGLTTTIIDDDSTAGGRGQLLLDSHYSDMIIASRNANANKHGSTLTFATQSTANNDYAKIVVGQGQYQEGNGLLAFAHGVNQTNPHNILGTDNANAGVVMDLYNKRIGIGGGVSKDPLTNVHVSGGKIAIASTDNSYGQIRVANTSASEVSIGFLGGVTESTLAASSPTATYRWAMGLNIYGIGANTWGVSNQGIGAGGSFRVNSDGSLAQGATTWLDASRNLTNIGTITGALITTSRAGVSASFNRTDNDAIIELKRNGTTRGFIGANTSNDIKFYNQSAAGTLTISSSGNLGTTGTISSGAVSSSGSYTVPNTSQNGLKSANGNNFFLPLDQYNNMHIRSTTGSEYHDSSAYFFRKVDQTEIFRITGSGVDVRLGTLAVNGTTRIDASGNATLGTISSGNITSSGNVVSTGTHNGSQFRASLGTQSAPAYTFKTDDDTGFYGGGNTVYGVTGGQKRLTLNASGVSAHNDLIVLTGNLKFGTTTIIDFNRDITARQATFTHTDHNYIKIENLSVAKEQMVRFRNSQTNYWYAGIRTSAGIGTTTGFHIYSTALGNDALAIDIGGDTYIYGALRANNVTARTASSGVKIGSFTDANTDESSNVPVWLRTGTWDNYLIKGSTSRGKFGTQFIGEHIDSSKSWGVFSNGWDTELQVNGDGRTYLKGPVGINYTPTNNNYGPLGRKANLVVSDAVATGTNSTIAVECNDQGESSLYLCETSGSSGFGARLYYEGLGDNFFNIEIVDDSGGTKLTAFTIERDAKVGINKTNPVGRLDVHQTYDAPSMCITSSNPSSWGASLLIGNTVADQTLVDANDRPMIVLDGKYPVFNMNHTVTSNSNHGPTIQFTFDGLTTGGSTGRQIVIGTSGTGSRLDFGFSGGALGSNTNKNPHNGIAGYQGVTPMRLFSNGLLLGTTGSYPNEIDSISKALDVRGNVQIVGSGGDADPLLRLEGSASATFNHSMHVLQPNMTVGEANILVVGQATGSANSGYIGYYRGGGNGSADNFMSIGLWGYDHIFRFYRDGDLHVRTGSVLKTAYNQAYMLQSSGTSSSGSAIGFQQITAEGWSGIFVDYNPYEGWGLYHDNPSNYFYITAETTTGSLGTSFTVPNRGSSSSTAYAKIRFDQNNGNINAGGAITAQGNVTAYASDRRLKTNFRQIESAVDKVKKLNGMIFDWNDVADANGFTPDRKHDDIGLIAQEVEAIVPQAVELAPFDTEVVSTPIEKGNKNGGNIEEKRSISGEDYLTVNYSKLVPLLVNAIKEQADELAELKDIIKEIKNGNHQD